MTLICWIFGHKYVPLNDHENQRLVICMRCGDDRLYQSVSGGKYSWVKHEIPNE